MSDAAGLDGELCVVAVANAAPHSCREMEGIETPHQLSYNGVGFEAYSKLFKDKLRIANYSFFTTLSAPPRVLLPFLACCIYRANSIEGIYRSAISHIHIRTYDYYLRIATSPSWPSIFSSRRSNSRVSRNPNDETSQ